MIKNRGCFKVCTKRAVFLSACLTGLALFSGCGAPSPEQRVSQARQDYQQHNYHAAEVQLKTVLRKHPDNGEAWLLLGRTSMANRQYGDALHQFHEAKSAGQPAAALALPLGRALVASGQFNKALDVLQTDGNASDQVRASVASLRGDALAALDKKEKAAKAYASALSIKPMLPDALRGKARLAIQRGDLQSAQQALTKAVSVNSDDARSLALLGQVDYRMDRCKDATRHLSRAIKTGSGALTGGQVETTHVLMADCQMRMGQAKAAQQNVQAVLSNNQSNPFANYLQALLDIRQGEYQKASNHVQAILNLNPRNLRSMTLMAWIRIAQGRPNDAQPFLTRVLQKAPDNIAALRLQAGLWMAQNQDQQARELIDKASRRHSGQPGLHEALNKVMAELKQQSANGDNGTQGLDNVTLQLGLARSLAQMGSQSAAQTILGKIQPKTAAQKHAMETARVQIALAARDTDDAIQRAKALVKNNPHDMGAKRLLADSYIAAGQYDAADNMLAKAQKSSANNANNTAIIRARTRLATQRGHYAQAIGLLEPLHEKTPDNVELTLALADLYGRMGNDDKRIDLLAKAVGNKSNAPRLRKALARAYLTSGKTDKAMSLIDGQLKTQDKDADWLKLKGVAQIVDGQTDAGIKTLAQAADQAPNKPGLALDVAKAQLSVGHKDQAIQRLQQLRKQSPDFWPAAAFLALAQASAGHTAEALKQINAVRDSGHGYEASMLDGDVLYHAKRYKQANKAYAEAFDSKPSARLALALFHTRRDGNLDDPAQPLRQWLNRAPGDNNVALELAGWYQAHGEDDKAATVYEKVLSKHDNAVVALNNLAVIQTDSNPAQALSYARRAHVQAPKSPAITDTLGWLLVKNDQLDKGIPLLEQAEAKAGSASPEIRFHLGAALAQRARADDIARAEKLLNKALSDGLPDEKAKQAQKIVARLGQHKTDKGASKS